MVTYINSDKTKLNGFRIITINFVVSETFATFDLFRFVHDNFNFKGILDVIKQTAGTIDRGTCCLCGWSAM